MRLHAQSSKTNTPDANSTFHHIAPCEDVTSEVKDTVNIFSSVINGARPKVIRKDGKIGNLFDADEF